MSRIISIGTAVPSYCHQQMDIYRFARQVHASNEEESRRMRFMYNQSGISTRYSVIPDYSREIGEWKFYPQTEGLDPFPSIEQRMALYTKQAPLLSVDAIRACLGHKYSPKSITHLITVSCTGMSAPGLDLQVMELMDLPRNIFRTSVNFMGCYAAVHALKLADAICDSDTAARVLVVCTELCTIHFQRENTMDNIASSLLFGDGSAAALITPDNASKEGVVLDSFYSEVVLKGKRDMAWELSSTGFLMTLSGYIPDLIEEDFRAVFQRALDKGDKKMEDVDAWCIHPGGKKVLKAIQKSLGIGQEQLTSSYEVLDNYGNLSSATILFVLKKMMERKQNFKTMAGAAFGPGLTVETFLAHS